MGSYFFNNKQIIIFRKRVGVFTLHCACTILALVLIAFFGIPLHAEASGWVIDPGETLEFPYFTTANKDSVSTCDGLNSCGVGWSEGEDWELYVWTIFMAGVLGGEKHASGHLGIPFEISGQGDNPITSILVGDLSWDGWLYTASGIGDNQSTITLTVSIYDITEDRSVVSQKIHTRSCSTSVLDPCVTHDTGSGPVNLTASLIRGHEYEIWISAESKCKVGAIGVDLASIYSPANCPDFLPGCGGNYVRVNDLTLIIGRDIAGELDELQSDVSDFYSEFETHSHSYKTGPGVGHNRVDAETTVPKSP